MGVLSIFVNEVFQLLRNRNTEGEAEKRLGAHRIAETHINNLLTTPECLNPIQCIAVKKICSNKVLLSHMIGKRSRECSICLSHIDSYFIMS